ncbi:MAG: ATP-dependent Lhr-like helicase [Planctomycetota bacterium]|jgi:ATP-dependent Lhr-like helicase
MNAAITWFQARGWEPFDFQRDTWAHYLEGGSGLVHAPTGFGKSLAAWMGPLIDAQQDERALRPPSKRSDSPPLTVIWVTPMRALAKDLVQNLGDVAADIAPGWTVESRSGDTPSTVRGRQARRLPTALVTTPESLTVLLSGADAAERFHAVRCVVVDEWHELFGTKRGVQTELALARLRTLGASVQTWGLSATLGNLEQAAEALLGERASEGPSKGHSEGPPNNPKHKLIRGTEQRDLRVETILPTSIERFPWSGHMGLRLLNEVAAELDTATSALVFTNTRRQAERWYQALCYARYEQKDRIALHHGSLDQEQRHEVERGLRSGELWAVVATSSLDLGVDFTPVDLVFQIGSPKGVARLAQRAGRSGHSPGRPSRLINVPAQALELIEFAAARDALARGDVESRPPILRPLDVLAQHVVTVAIGGGFRSDELLAEVRTTHAYRDLTDEEWIWVLEFARFGGETLSGYERFARIRQDKDGVFVGGNKRVIREHRLNIGTISGSGSLNVAYRNGRRLGHVEETFLSRLRPGESFTFAGKAVELIRIEDATAYVRPAKKASALLPSWSGGRMPLSNELTQAVRRAMASVTRVLETGELSASPELNAVAPILALQRQASRIPAEHELLIERIRTRDGDHAFLFPLAGRLVHEGLAALLAWRATQRTPITITQSVSDWGIELLAGKDLPVHDDEWRALLSPDRLLEDLLQCLDGAGLAKRHFREIARVAGLIHPGLPGARKGQRQLQASSGLIFEVLSEHDPDNLLLVQARREVMERVLELTRMREALEAIQRCEIRITRPAQLTPLAFPLWAERMRDRVSSESWEDRVRAMAAKLEAAAP